jgi:uncharacterized protein YeaO (DUF488 family)
VIQEKSVHSPIDKKRDGLRVLASRFRGRGMPNSRYDVWMPNLGPSERLLRKLLDGQITWAAFSRAYRKELFDGGSADSGNKLIKNHGQKFTLRLLQRLAEDWPVTVMCQCAEEQKQCHRFLLKGILRGKI